MGKNGGERHRAMRQDVAYKCEMAIEQRCRCRCGGKLHGAKRSPIQVEPDDAHAVAFWCSHCGQRLPEASAGVKDEAVNHGGGRAKRAKKRSGARGRAGRGKPRRKSPNRARGRNRGGNRGVSKRAGGAS